MNNDRVNDIIDQLQQLHIQQLELLSELHRQTAHEDPHDRISTTAEVPSATQAPIADTRTNIRTTTATLHIGDRVRILNPRFLQPTTGTIIKITTSRITIQTPSGNTIIRAPKNVIRID